MSCSQFRRIIDRYPVNLGILGNLGWVPSQDLRSFTFLFNTMLWWPWMTFSVDKNSPECRSSFIAALTFLSELDTSSAIPRSAVQCSEWVLWISVILGIKIFDFFLGLPIQWKYFADPTNYSLILNRQGFSHHLSFMPMSSSITCFKKSCRFSDTFWL